MPSQRSPSGRTRRRCYRASISATREDFKPPCCGRRSAHGRPIRSTTTLATPVRTRRQLRQSCTRPEPLLGDLRSRCRRSADLALCAGRPIRSQPASGPALLLAFSYTFWSQAIIAEVYTLHLTLVRALLLALHAYAARPSRGRLAIFFARLCARLRQSPVDDPAASCRSRFLCCR